MCAFAYIFRTEAREMEMTNELRTLDKAEAKAFRAMMNGSELDARSVFGEEGKNYAAWCAAADACYEYRKTHGLIGEGH